MVTASRLIESLKWWIDRATHLPQDKIDALADECGQNSGDAFGGQNFYVPKGTLQKIKKMHRAIRAQYDGTNRDNICHKFGTASSTSTES